MAIVHVAFKSSSSAPPAAAHADYIARAGQYKRRGPVELVESGNMPEFAQTDPRSFWVAADAHERSNGRTYTEIQLALPRELDESQRKSLALDVTRELLGDRFAYTLALHVPVAKDNIAQPHLHLMFSERAIDEVTRALPEERFFKRNGAKKDTAWNDRNKPDEVRQKWVEMMNRAMAAAEAGQQLDARSWADQGRDDLAALIEPKLLGGDGEDARKRQEEVAELRTRRQKLPAPFIEHRDHPRKPLVDIEPIIEQLNKELEEEIARLEKECEEQNGILERMLEAMRETARGAVAGVREWGAEIAGNITKRIEPLFGAKEPPVAAEAAFKGAPGPDTGATNPADSMPPCKPEAAQAEIPVPAAHTKLSAVKQRNDGLKRDLEEAPKAAEAAMPPPVTAPPAQPPSPTRQTVAKKVELPAAPKPAEAAVIRRAKIDNNLLLDIARQVEQKGTAPVGLVRHQVALVCDAMLGGPIPGRLHGETGSGCGMLSILERGQAGETVGQSLKGIISLFARRKDTGFEYMMIAANGKVAEFVSQLREAAAIQLKRDSAILLARERKRLLKLEQSMQEQKPGRDPKQKDRDLGR